MAETSDPPNPQAPVLFFDGECALCHGAVRRLLRWERGHVQNLLFAPLDGTTAQHLRRKGELPLSQDAVVLWTPDETLMGEAAMGASLAVIGRTGWARIFHFLPAPLRRFCYRTLARRRHQWFGRVPATCPVPSHPLRFKP